MSNKKQKKQEHRAEMRRLKRLKKQTSKPKKPEIKPIEITDISASQDKGDLGGHIITEKAKVVEPIINNQNTMETKSIFRSKLFWLGAINVIIGVLQYIGGALDTGVAITINGIAIVVLRALTSQGIYLKK